MYWCLILFLACSSACLKDHSCPELCAAFSFAWCLSVSKRRSFATSKLIGIWEFVEYIVQSWATLVWKRWNGWLVSWGFVRYVTVTFLTTKRLDFTGLYIIVAYDTASLEAFEDPSVVYVGFCGDCNKPLMCLFLLPWYSCLNHDEQFDKDEAGGC